MKIKRKKHQSIKTLMIVAVCLNAALILSGVAYAWFTNQRKLHTISRVNSPTSLCIGAGAKEDVSNIDMGGIDVTDPAGKKDFVFCVYSDDYVGNYKIQLAHTTNIDFTYEIYPATSAKIPTPEGDSVLYVDKNGKSHYYFKDPVIPLSGRYRNQDGSGTSIADKSLHDKSYGNYSFVQKNAEPLYWQSESINPDASNVNFVDYYILEVSWDSDKVTNDKETDMVYLSAGMA